jgi:hypothetical protein
VQHRLSAFPQSLLACRTDSAEATRDVQSIFGIVAMRATNDRGAEVSTSLRQSGSPGSFLTCAPVVADSSRLFRCPADRCRRARRRSAGRELHHVFRAPQARPPWSRSQSPRGGRPRRECVHRGGLESSRRRAASLRAGTCAP